MIVFFLSTQGLFALSAFFSESMGDSFLLLDLRRPVERQTQRLTALFRAALLIRSLFPSFVAT
jgi:hypothetical protein